MITDQLTIRHATAADATIVAEHRVRLFVDTGRLDAEQAAALRARLPAILEPMLASGEYIGWFATTPNDDVVAGAGVQMRHLLPRPETFTEREALVVNVYVAPEYRRQGLARRLMTTILDWCKEQGIERVVLHPSSLGRPLYESLGFVPTNELVCHPTRTRAVEVQPAVKHTSE
ncbi:MAG: GNAT family N-acetyltransferase [Ktedonobacterales bacterium]